MPPELEPAVLGDVVGALLESEVVDVEARRLVATLTFIRVRSPAILPKGHHAGVAAQRFGERIELDVSRVGPLKAVNVVPLKLFDRLGRAVDAAARPIAIQAPSLADSPVVVDASGDRAVRQERHAFNDIAVGGREDETKR